MGPRLLSSWGRGCRFVRPFVCGCESLCLDPDAPTKTTPMPIVAKESNRMAFLFRVFQVTIKNPAWRTVSKPIFFFFFSLKYTIYFLSNVTKLQIFQYELTAYQFPYFTTIEENGEKQLSIFPFKHERNVQHHFGV